MNKPNIPDSLNADMMKALEENIEIVKSDLLEDGEISK